MFGGSDFNFWKMQIEDYLYQKDIHEPLTGVKPESMTEEKWKLKDRQALGLIRLTLSRNVEFSIVKEKTTSGLLKELSNMYEKPSAMNKVYLMRRLFNLQMSETRSVSDHINEFNMIVSQLNSVDINFKDEIKALILDSGASVHSSPSKELFQNFKSGNFGKVYLADNKALDIERKGDVCIKTPSGSQWTLEDVRYIPGFQNNLISIG